MDSIKNFMNIMFIVGLGLYFGLAELKNEENLIQSFSLIFFIWLIVGVGRRLRKEGINNLNLRWAIALLVESTALATIAVVSRTYRDDWAILGSIKRLIH